MLRARPAIYWALFGLSAFLFLFGQFVTVVPYENYDRDYLIFSVVTGGFAAVCLTLAILTIRQRRGARDA